MTSSCENRQSEKLSNRTASTLDSLTLFHFFTFLSQSKFDGRYICLIFHYSSCVCHIFTNIMTQSYRDICKTCQVILCNSWIFHSKLNCDGMLFGEEGPEPNWWLLSLRWQWFRSQEADWWHVIFSLSKWYYITAVSAAHLSCSHL